MISVNSVTKSAVALSILESISSRQVKTSAESENQVLRTPDPRSAFSLSMEAADTIFDLVHGTKNSASSSATHTAASSRPDRSTSTDHNVAIPTEARFSSDMAKTPIEFVNIIKRLGATRWIATPISHLDEASLAAEVRKNILEAFQRGDRSERNQAIVDGSAVIIKGNDVPEHQWKHYNYTLYAPDPVTGSLRQTGEVSGASGNDAYYSNYEASHPGSKISSYVINGDIALIIYPSKPGTQEMVS